MSWKGWGGCGFERAFLPVNSPRYRLSLQSMSDRCLELSNRGPGWRVNLITRYPICTGTRTVCQRHPRQAWLNLSCQPAVRPSTWCRMHKALTALLFWPLFVTPGLSDIENIRYRFVYRSYIRKASMPFQQDQKQPSLVEFPCLCVCLLWLESGFMKPVF